MKHSKPKEEPRCFQKKNQAIVSKWLRALQVKGLDHDCQQDMRDCLLEVESLDPDEKDQTQFIMSSEEMNEWFQIKHTSFFELDPQTPPNNVSNSLSFTSARLLVALRILERFPALGFFCRHRNTDSSSESKSGPIALVRSFNGQLLEFIAKHKPGLDISMLKRSLLAKAKNELDDGLTLFRKLLIMLEEEDESDKFVFLIIDSLSSLSADTCESHDMMEELWEIICHRESLVIKVLVTDSLVTSPVKKRATLSLLVPDLVGTAASVMENDGETSNRIERSISE